MNGFREDLLRDLEALGVKEICGESSDRRSTSGSGVSSDGVGVFAIGTPSTKMMSLRRRGEGGEAEMVKGKTGMVGKVAALV